MQNKLSPHETNVATATHLSTFLKYVFPFGNFVAPILLWVLHKEKPFVEEHARQSINFQLSVFVYSLVIGLICLPFVIIFAVDFIALAEALDQTVHYNSLTDITNISGYAILIGVVILLYVMLFIIELYCVISASLKASRGAYYNYPMCIPFIKKEPQQPEPSTNQNNQKS